MRPNTQAQYRQAVEIHVLPRRIACVSLQAVTPEHLDRLYRQLERHGRRAEACRTAGVTCPDHGCAPERHKGLAPKSVRHRPHRHRAAKAARERVWNSDQLRAFLTAAQPELLYPLFFLVATTGLRRGEACALDLDDLDVDAATVTVNEAKGEAGERTIALDGATVSVLRDWLVHRKELRLAAGSVWSDSSRLFTDEIGQPVKPDRVTGGSWRSPTGSACHAWTSTGFATAMPRSRCVQACPCMSCPLASATPTRRSRFRCTPTTSRVTTTPQPRLLQPRFWGRKATKACTC